MYHGATKELVRGIHVIVRLYSEMDFKAVKLRSKRDVTYLFLHNPFLKDPLT